MKKIYIALQLTTISLVAFLTFGCTERSLEYRDHNINIAIEWIDVPNPAGAVFYFYPTNGDSAIIKQTPASGFTGFLPAGEYDVLVFSPNPQNVELNGLESYQSAQIDAIINNSLITPPGHLGMGNQIEGRTKLVIPERGSVNEKIKAYQQTHTFHIMFALQGDLTAVNGISGLLLGTAPSITCSTAIPDTARIPTAYTTSARTPSNTLSASFTALGYNLSAGTGDLSFTFLLNSTPYTGMLDLTTQIELITEAHGGKLPLDVYIYVILSYNRDVINPIQATATVKDWLFNGDGWAVMN